MKKMKRLAPHGHNHHHDHEGHIHLSSSGDNGENLTITTHDEAVVGSLSKELALSYEEGANAARSYIRDLGTWVENVDGVVGHIKSYVQSFGESSSLSYTEGTVTEKRNPPPAFLRVDIAAIVFLVTPDELRNKMDKLMDTYFQ